AARGEELGQAFAAARQLSNLVEARRAHRPIARERPAQEIFGARGDVVCRRRYRPRRCVDVHAAVCRQRAKLVGKRLVRVRRLPTTSLTALARVTRWVALGSVTRCCRARIRAATPQKSSCGERDERRCRAAPRTQTSPHAFKRVALVCYAM